MKRKQLLNGLLLPKMVTTNSHWSSIFRSDTLHHPRGDFFARVLFMRKACSTADANVTELSNPLGRPAKQAPSGLPKLSGSSCSRRGLHRLPYPSAASEFAVLS